MKKSLFILTSILTASCLFSCNPRGKQINIQLLATSDIHGKLIPFDYALDEVSQGSIAQIATAINTLKTDNTILIDAGDVLQGNSAELFKDEDTHPMIEALNKLNYDVFVTGNHEYNFGMTYLEKQLSKFKGKALIGNVFNKSSGKSLADSYTIITKGEVKVAIIGMTTPNITKWDGEKLIDWNVTNPIEETKKIAKKIKEDKLADIIVAAEHIGFKKEYDTPGTSAIDLANECPELDVIIASHEHEKHESELVNGVLLVENAANAKTMEQINLEVEKNGNNVKVKNKTAKSLDVTKYAIDQDIYSFAEPFDRRAKIDARTNIGTLVNAPLAKEYIIHSVPSTFMEPTSLIGIINRVQLDSAQKYLNDHKELTTLPLKVTGTAMGNYWANIKNNGDIRKCDVSNIYKYSNTLYILEMTGKQLKSYLEWTAKFYKQYKQGDLTISFMEDIATFNLDMFMGLDYKIDVSKDVGERITQLNWDDGLEVKEDEKFLIAANNYRASSHLLSDAIYKDPNNKPKLVVADVSIDGTTDIREMIINYIKKDLKGQLDGNDPTFVSKWELVEPGWDKEKRKLAIEQINNGKLTVGPKNNITITEKDLK